MCHWTVLDRQCKVVRGLTLSVLDVELVDLLSELIFLDGLSARDRQRETSLKVLHLVHGAERERERERTRHTCM